MSNPVPTPEQLAVIEAFANTQDSLEVQAVAGSGKTSTLAMASARLPVLPTICLAFNKKNAEDMARRLPSFVTCSTVNALGHRVWGQTTGKKLKLETGKVYDALSEYMNKVKDAQLKRQLGEDFAALLRVIRLAKALGYVPAKMREFGRSLLEVEDLLEAVYSQVDINMSDEYLFVLDQILEQGIADSYRGVIDFDDQVYMSALFGGVFPKYSCVMVDEAQDLSPLNHEILERLAGGRVIAVGDPYQAIYAFRGASHTSMEQLSTRFGMRRLPLSVAFRCPRLVADNVKWHVPHIQSPDWAADGAVVHLDHWTPAMIPDGAAIICRANAPLFSMAMRLIRAKRGIKILGNDIGAGLIKLMKKLGSDTDPSEVFLGEIKTWEAKELTKADKRRHAAIHDKADCLRAFARDTRTRGEAIAYAEMIFKAEGPIQLMTGHKSKGGEWDVVFFLDSFLIPSKFALRAAEEGDNRQLTQERNLKYVIETRAKQTLYYVNSDEFRLEDF